MDSWKIAADYHQTTKHHFNRYARSLGYMDWANQPDPFRRFHGAPITALALASNSVEPAYDALFEPAGVPAKPVSFETISAFLEFSLALSAWKEFQGSRWALRVNPSSGNLHPTEGYIVAGGIDGLHDRAGVYHYAPKAHALERRTELMPEVWARLGEGFPPETFFVGLSSIHWREAWKYGERAYRYCQHDVGHALAALSLSAVMQGWQTRWLHAVGDAQVSTLLGLDRAQDFEGAEREQPDLLVAVFPAVASTGTSYRADLPPDAVAQVAGGVWQGKANRLSPDHVDWQLIDSVAEACRKPAEQAPADPPSAPSFSPMRATNRTPVSAGKIIRQRRSAVDMDGRTSITADQLFVMLDRVLPRAEQVPFGTIGPPVCIHLVLFVHRVDGLASGLYLLVRRPQQVTRLREAMRAEFTWDKPAGCPDGLPLFELMTGDHRQMAGQLSCGQAIAADGAFSVGMIAEFEKPLRDFGGWFYRRLFWETGLIGQMLYLEAEAAGVRGTGIGCFFDDEVHELLGLQDMTYQSLYHFTIGGLVEDPRLTTLPPYPADGSGRP